MISTNRQLKNLFQSSSTSKKIPKSIDQPVIDSIDRKPSISDPINTSTYDDVYGFSEDEQSINDQPQKSIDNRSIDRSDQIMIRSDPEIDNRTRSISIDQRSCTKNGVTAMMTTIKPKSKVISDRSILSNKIDNRDQKRLIPVMAPKPPSTFSTFVAQKSSIDSRNRSIAKDTDRLVIDNRKIDHLPTDPIDQEFNAEIRRRIKQTRQVFATMPNQVTKTRPPIPIGKDYRSISESDQGDRIDNRKVSKVSNGVAVLPVTSPSVILQVSKSIGNIQSMNRSISGDRSDQIDRSADRSPCDRSIIDQPPISQPIVQEDQSPPDHQSIDRSAVSITPIKPNLSIGPPPELPMIVQHPPVDQSTQVPPPVPRKLCRSIINGLEVIMEGKSMISSPKSRKPNMVMSTSMTAQDREVSNGRLIGGSIGSSGGRIWSAEKERIEASLLNDFIWFHGDIDRKEAECRLAEFRMDGSFLIRYKSTPCDQSPFSLSVLQNGKIYHLQIRRKSNGAYALGDCKPNELEFAQLHEIVSYHRRNPLQLIRRKSGELAGLALLTSAPPK